MVGDSEVIMEPSPEIAESKELETGSSKLVGLE